MTIFIEGLAFPLDEINANGWGVPGSEKDNAIESLKNSVIRICTRSDPHACDLSEDPYSEIGRITDAWERGGKIYAKGIITDSVAEQKILDGTWGKNWSVFAYEESNKGGFSQGFMARSMTLVQNPAWETANWVIVAAKDSGAKNRKPVSSASNSFTVSNLDSNSTKTNTKKSACSKRKGDSMTDNPDPNIQELLSRLEALEKATIQPGQSEITDSVTASIIKDVAASVKNLENDLKGKEARIATLEKELSTAIPADKFPDMLTAALKEEKDKDTRAAAYTRFASVRTERGLETKEEDYTAMTAADFERSISELETLRPVAGGAQYPRGAGTESAGANTGTYDPFTKSWKV